MAGVRFTDLQSRPMEFLDFTSLTLDEFQQLVPPFEAAFHARMAAWRMDGKRFCRKVALLRPNEKIPCRKINDLRVSTFLFSVICDRTVQTSKSWPCRACSHGWLYGGRRGVPPGASGPSACRSTAPRSRPHAERLTLRPDFHARRERPPRRTTHEHMRMVSFHMRGASLPRSLPMELHTRVELIDTLLEG